MFAFFRQVPALAAFCAALGMVGAGLEVAAIYADKVERHNIRLVTLELAHEQDSEAEHAPRIQRAERMKNQGMSLQRAALQLPDLVSLYGSSELRKPIPDKAGIFFSHYPTGFAVFQVGKGGSTSLIIQQKVAASMPQTGARRIAISLSSTWFLSAPDEHAFAGNFSSLQALRILFDPRLSFELKRDLSQRLLFYPKTVTPSSFLGFAAAHLATSTLWDRLVYYAIYPLGSLLNAVHSAQDRYETALYIQEERPGWREEVTQIPNALDWPALLEDATRRTQETAQGELLGHDRYIHDDAGYRLALGSSPEWGDFELLLRTFHELHVEPLILTMPPDVRHYMSNGVQRSSLLLYTARLRALCDRYGARLESFDDHMDDPLFLTDHQDHMSVEGWMYYNKALDDYFHRRARLSDLQPEPEPEREPEPASASTP